MARNSSDLFTMPAGPADLCFDKNEFMKKTFSVDDFLHENRNAASLETIRDDLGIYLKVLRSAMIELINEDYADFVDLSANLIGLDNSINAISSPLEKLKDEIMNVKYSLTDCMKEISDCLEQKKALRCYTKSLQSLSKVQESLEKLTKLLENSCDSDVKPTLLERAALESIQLQFNMKFCDDFLEEEQKLLSAELRVKLLDEIKRYFLNTLNHKDNEGLERCLRIFCTLDECESVEKLFRTKIIAPFMYKVISESNLQNSPQGLNGIYNQILEFISLNMKDLLMLTKKNGKVKGFNFILNSFWVEVEGRMETNMSSIFAPGNPDAFYQKYKSTLEFLERIQLIIEDPDDVLKFTEHPQYRKFQIRWNLPVYFQIRFQEIGAHFETSCSKRIVLLQEIKANQFNLPQFTSALSCISKCWQDGTYLPQLFHKFFKLTLQILSRITNWIEETMTNNDIKFYVTLYTDIVILIQKIPTIFDLTVEKSPAVLHDSISTMEKCFNESKSNLAEKQEVIQAKIIKELTVNSVVNVKQVNDIPRLYRKTNRDIPNKCCQYVELILGPTKQFHQQYERVVGEEMIRIFLTSIYSNLTVQYYQVVEEVLTSVQKTEESLRRLKNLRDRGSGAVVPSLSTSVSASLIGDRVTMSDDDKIRLQLHVDVISYTNEIESFKLERSQIEKLPDLIQLVEDATKIKINN